MSRKIVAANGGLSDERDEVYLMLDASSCTFLKFVILSEAKAPNIRPAA